ncbi:MAG: hypothetical protein AVO34_02045 [Firmicutes bacterium ML8_F2]|jgi:O-antigen ligase|nr:MAG: hypothetical protein AVO34_02045 [Firmicutes bacterium ML8_F2]
MSIVETKKNFFYFILALVLLRPSLDIFSKKEFLIHPALPYLNFNIILGGLVFLICLIPFLKRIKLSISTPLFYPVFFLLGLGLISIFYSLDALISLKEFIRLAGIFLLYFLAYRFVENRKDWLLLLKIILISYLLPGFFALIQLIGRFGLPDDFGSFNRIYGTFAHPNLFAFYSFFVLGLSLSLLIASLNKKEAEEPLWKNSEWHIWLMIVFSLTLLFATYSRSALACLLIFILFIGILKYRKLLLAGLFLFLAAYFFSDVFQQRFWEMLTLDPYGSVVWRFRLWQDVIPASLWQPWFGYGLGSFPKLVEFYRGFKWGSLEAHNDYLKIFVENGVLGITAYFWLIIALLYKLFKIFREKINQDKTLGLGILVICLSLFVASFFDNILRTTALQWNLWILLAAWLKINRN